jgi:hypothetical protein
MLLVLHHLLQIKTLCDILTENKERQRIVEAASIKKMWITTIGQ